MKHLVVETAITLAMTFIGFTAGVWLVNKTKKLKPFHVILFWIAFCCACAGAGLLEITVGGGNDIAENVRGISEIISLVIMFIYSIWATALTIIPDEKSRRIFVRDSRLVWKIWLVPFVLQIILGFV